MVLIFSILVAAAVMTHLVPAGEFERRQVDGITRIVPGSFHTVEANPASPLDVFVPPAHLHRGTRERCGHDRPESRP